MRTIQFYRTSTDRCLVEEYLDTLPDRHAQKVLWVFRLVEKFDIVPQKYFKKLVGTDDLWEIRIQIGSNNYRFLCFYDGPSLLVLTSGFSKKEQKTPLREIELAHQRKREYLSRRT